MPTAKKTTKKIRTVLDTLSDKLIADVVRSLPAKEREPLEALCMGRALVDGEVVIPDGKDLPPKIRAANLKRIKAIKDPNARAALLRGDVKTPRKVTAPKKAARAKAAA